jgi:hypothetical protein
MKLLITLSLALALLLVSCGGEERTSGVHRIEKDGVALSITLPQGWNADLSQAPPTPETIETLLYAAKAGEGEVSLWYNPEPFLRRTSSLWEMRRVLDGYGDSLEGHGMKGLERTQTTLGGYPAELFIVPATTGGEAKLTHQVAFFAKDRMWILNCIEQKGAGLCEGVVSSVN